MPNASHAFSVGRGVPLSCLGCFARPTLHDIQPRSQAHLQISLGE